MYGWRGTIGLVKPTYRAGPLEAFIRFMPDGVCVVVLTNVPADVWASFKHLRIHEPIEGFGRLLAELP